MTKRLRIVSDGTATLYDADGDRVKFGSAQLMRIEVAPIVPGGTVNAVLFIHGVGLDIDVEAEERQP